MHCVYPSCDHEACRTYSQGITFFRFPEEISLRTAWLEALGKEGWDPDADSAVCSVHFLTEDFLVTRNGYKLRTDAVPIVNLQVCRICFARECKLYPMKNYMHLDKAYETLTGFSIEKEEKLPSYLCIECANRLLNSTRFKAKSIRAHAILLEIVNEHGYITLESIISASSTHNPFTSYFAHNRVNTEHIETENTHTDEESDIKNDDITLGDMKTEANGADVNIITDDKCDFHLERISCLQEDPMEVVFKSEDEDAISDEIVNKYVMINGDDVCLPIIQKDIVVDQVKKENNVIINRDNVDAKSISRVEKGDVSIDEDCSSTQTRSSRLATKKVKLNFTREEMSTTVKDLSQMKGDKYSKREGNGGLLLSYKLLSCDICAYQTVSEVQLTHHLKAHAATKLYSCKKCNFNTKFKKKLEFHMEIHSDRKPYSCNLCHKIFSHNSDLKTHFRIHSGEKPYSCNMCNKTFNQDNQLKSHMRIHSGERPYCCNVCNKAFRQRGQLQNHLRIHTGEKPYSCNVCNKAFIQRGQLQNHLRIHTGEKPYACNVCTKAFVQRGQLQNHLRIHSSEK